MGRGRRGAHRLVVVVGLAVTLALALVVTGIGPFAPVVQAASPQTFTCVNGTFDEATFQSYLSAGGMIAYTGTTPCTIPLSTTLTIGAGQTVTIDGGVGLTLTGSGAGTAIAISDTANAPSSLTLRRVSVTGVRTAIDGGFGAITLTDSTISASSPVSGVVDGNNSATGISSTSGAVTLTSSTVSASSPAIGGAVVGGINTATGIAGGAGAITLTNSTVSASSPVGSGGDVEGSNSATGIAGGAGAITLTSSTVSASSTVSGNVDGDNSATGISTPGALTLTATIVASANGASCDAGTFDDGGYNRSPDTTCSFTTLTSKGDFPAGLNLLPLGNYGGPTPTIALDAGSPAIDQIPPNTVVTLNGQAVTLCPASADGSVTDQRGVNRPQGTKCDIGAFERTTGLVLATCQETPAQADYTNGTQSWYGENVADHCSLIDDVSTTPIYDTVQLATTVVDGQANPSAPLGLASPDCSGTTCSDLTITATQACLSSTSTCVTLPGGTFAIDRQDPTISSSVAGQTYAFGQTITVPLTCGDGSGSGIATCQGTVTFPDSSTQALTSAGTSVQFSQVGDYQFDLSATDNVGNGATTQFSIAIATPAPTLTINGAAPQTASTYWYNLANSPNGVTLTVSDADSGVTSYRCTDNRNLLSLTASSGTPLTEMTTLADGTQTIACKATDETATSELTIITIQVDTQPPMITLTSPSAASYMLDQTVNAAFTCTDPPPGSGIATCQATDDGVAITNGSPLATSTLGSHTVTVNAKDNAGNAATTSVSYSVGYAITPLPGYTATVQRGYYAVLRFAPEDASGHDDASRTLKVTSVELDGPNGQVIPFVYPFRFGRFGGTPGYQLALNTRNLSRGEWTLAVKIGSGSQVTTGTVTLRVE